MVKKLDKFTRNFTNPKARNEDDETFYSNNAVTKGQLVSTKIHAAGRLDLFGIRSGLSHTRRVYISVRWVQEVVDAIYAYIRKNKETAKSMSYFIEVACLTFLDILTDNGWTVEQFARIYLERIPLTITLNNPFKDNPSLLGQYKEEVNTNLKTLGQAAYEIFELESGRQPIEYNYKHNRNDYVWNTIPEEQKNAWEKLATKIRTV